MYDFKEKCPYCGGEASCETVDVGVGSIQAGPYICYECESYELHSNDTDSKNANGEYHYTELERKTGWGKSPYVDLALMQKFKTIVEEIIKIEHRRYEDSRLTLVE